MPKKSQLVCSSLPYRGLDPEFHFSSHHYDDNKTLTEYNRQNINEKLWLEKTLFFPGAFTAWMDEGWLLPSSRPTPAPPFDRPSTAPGPADTLFHRHASPPPCSGWCRPHTPSRLLRCPQSRRRRRPGWGWRPTWSGPCCFWRKTTDPAGSSWRSWPSNLQSSWRARRRWTGPKTGPGGRTEGSEPPRSGRGLSEEERRISENMPTVNPVAKTSRTAYRRWKTPLWQSWWSRCPLQRSRSRCDWMQAGSFSYRRPPAQAPTRQRMLGRRSRTRWADWSGAALLWQQNGFSLKQTLLAALRKSLSV